MSEVSYFCCPVCGALYVRDEKHSPPVNLCCDHVGFLTIYSHGAVRVEANLMPVGKAILEARARAFENRELAPVRASFSRYPSHG